MTFTSSPSLSLEARVVALEAQLGIRTGAHPTKSTSPNNNNSNTNDLSHRLDALQSTMEQHTSLSFRETLKESVQLMDELDPGMALTHQQQPSLYRHQQVLAGAKILKADLDQLSQLLHLLLTLQPPTTIPTTTTTGITKLRQEQVTQVLILVSSVTINPEDKRRVDALRLSLQDLSTRTQTLTTRMDQLLECYHTVTMAASEKCVLAEERLRDRCEHI
jgi:hypothetical protein